MSKKSKNKGAFGGRKRLLSEAEKTMVLETMKQHPADFTPEDIAESSELLGPTQEEMNDIRLRLRAEIRKRVSRIDLVFNAVVSDTPGVYEVQEGEGETIAKITFINGAVRWFAFVKDETKPYRPLWT